MRISEGVLHNLIYTGEFVTVSSENVDTYFTIRHRGEKEDVIEVQASTYFGDEIEAVQSFRSFRNGDAESPDMEQFLKGWYETLNADDCEVYF